MENLIKYNYTFPNPVRDLFELLLDLPILLFQSYEKTELPNGNGFIIIYLSNPELYKLKISEQIPNKRIVYNYDFMETHVGERGKLILKFNELSPKEVRLEVQNKINNSILKLWRVKDSIPPRYSPPGGFASYTDTRLVPCVPNWIGASLNEKLKSQDISKIFVTCKGKKILVQNNSIRRRNGQTLELSGLHITDIKNEVEGLENLIELTELYLDGNIIKEITGLSNLTNLVNLSLSGNKIEWISGLENLINLERLELGMNEIKEIEGLENLNNLKELYLSSNKISKIRGMENLENLQHFEIINNQISEDVLEELGGNAKSRYSMKPLTLNYVRFPQRFVRYCQKPVVEIEKEESIKQIKGKELIAKFKEITENSQKIRLSMLRNALNIDKSTFDRKIFQLAKENGLIISGDFLIKEEEIIETESLIEQPKNWEVQVCSNCGEEILENSQRICEFCGEEL